MNKLLDQRDTSGAGSLERLRELLDHHELIQLLNRYVHSADDGRWRDWAALFAEDATVLMPQGSHVGKTGLAVWAADSLSGYQRMMHFSGNLDISLSGDTAACRSKVLAVCVPNATEMERHLTWGGVYSIGFNRMDGQWKIAKLQFELVWSEGASVVEGPKAPGN